MTDVQVSRLFQICEQIAALKNTLGTPPESTEPQALARRYAPILAEHQALLDELVSLLWIAGSPEGDS